MKIINVILVICGLYWSTLAMAITEQEEQSESVVTSYKSYNPNRDDLDDVAIDEQREQIIATTTKIGPERQLFSRIDRSFTSICERFKETPG